MPRIFIANVHPSIRQLFRTVMKAPLPVTFCTVCPKAGYGIRQTNRRCEQIINGKRCKGVNQSAIGIYDWAECPSCNGTGTSTRTSNGRCMQCDGAGWLFVREEVPCKILKIKSNGIIVGPDGAS